VEEAGGVGQVKGTRSKGRLEDVPGDEANRGGKGRVRERFLSFADGYRVNVHGGEATIPTDPLTQALEPERRSGAGVEDVKAAYVTEKVELAVAKGDQTLLKFLAFARS
jgi:hypothetical protein